MLTTIKKEAKNIENLGVEKFQIKEDIILNQQELLDNENYDIFKNNLLFLLFNGINTSYDHNVIIPKDEIEYPNIEKLNNDADRREKEIEERLLQQHNKNLQWHEIIIRWLNWLYHFCAMVIIYRLPPIYINKQIMFSSTPSIYTFSNYCTTMPTHWYMGFGASGLFIYALKCAMYKNVSSPKLKSYFNTQIKFHKLLLQNMGIDQRIIWAAKKIAEEMAKYFKW